MEFYGLIHSDYFIRIRVRRIPWRRTPDEREEVIGRVALRLHGERVCSLDDVEPREQSLDLVHDLQRLEQRWLGRVDGEGCLRALDQTHQVDSDGRVGFALGEWACALVSEHPSVVEQRFIFQTQLLGLGLGIGLGLWLVPVVEQSIVLQTQLLG